MADAPLTLRLADAGDSRRVWEWRNDSTSRAVSGTSEVIAWPSHDAWFRSAVSDPARRVLIAAVRGTDIGIIRFDGDEHGDWTVSINLDPVARGQGRGTAALHAACRWLRQQTSTQAIHARILESNTASRRAFEAVGFALTASEDGWLRYVLNFED